MRLEKTWKEKDRSKDPFRLDEVCVKLLVEREFWKLLSYPGRANFASSLSLCLANGKRIFFAVFTRDERLPFLFPFSFFFLLNRLERKRKTYFHFEETRRTALKQYFVSFHRYKNFARSVKRTNDRDNWVTVCQILSAKFDKLSPPCFESNNNLKFNLHSLFESFSNPFQNRTFLHVQRNWRLISWNETMFFSVQRDDESPCKFSKKLRDLVRGVEREKSTRSRFVDRES